MLINKKFHLSYCTNIHPGENWEITFKNLKKYVPTVKASVASSEKFGLGLRLSNTASEELNKVNHLKEFKDWLDQNDIYVFTMNGFPYGNFHGERVKDKVHEPDWTTPARLEYTLRLFKQLNYLLPEGIDGGISTSPVTYKHWHQSAEAKEKALQQGATNMVQVAIDLYKIEQQTGKYLHLDIEPEPDGLLENSDELIAYFKKYLVPQGVLAGKEIGLTATESEALVKRHLTLCYDICHFSLAYEEPADTFKKLEKVGIQTGKIQVSAALKILADSQKEEAIWKSLQNFNEPTYLHQVTQNQNGTVKTYADLPMVLETKPEFKELRAHFHVPIFVEKFELLHSTQDHILKVVDLLKEQTLSKHLEIETYTWKVLPKELKLELGASIIREVAWLKTALQ